MSSYEYDDMGRLKIKHLDPYALGGNFEFSNHSIYPVTVEAQNAPAEDELFSEILIPATTKPIGFDEDSNNKKVSRLDRRQVDNILPRTGVVAALRLGLATPLQLRLYMVPRNISTTTL